MKADLIGIADDHKLVSVGGDRAVNDIITPVWMGSAVVEAPGSDHLRACLSMVVLAKVVVVP
jgi:hypothetical protein